MVLSISNRRFRITFLTLVTLSTIQFCKSELFTAITDMEKLLGTEAMLINNLEAYVAAQENKLTHLRWRISEYQKEHDEAAKDITTYIANPINAYLLTKRLTTDWAILEQMMSHNVGTEILRNVTSHREFMIFPSDEDLNGAAIAIIRLQDTYNLDTANLARGEINGVKYSSQMSSHDCFELGRQSFLNDDYDHTILWMNEAMARLNNNINESIRVSKPEILEYLASSFFKQGNTRSALEMTNELLELVPNHENAATNKIIYKKELEKEAEVKADKMVRVDEDSSELDEHRANEEAIAKGFYTPYEHKMYEKLCRGDIGQEPHVLAQLKCRYVTNKPFLKIAPLKLEEASLKPYIVVYHDVIYDNEIEIIKKLTKPRFRRAAVQDSNAMALKSDYRISKSAWLRDEKHEIIRIVGQRVEDMTGLTVATAEQLQVVNYGIGGFYKTHFDFAEEDDGFDDLGTGNRIATVLFYMSDVTEGGATVFPGIKVAVRPKKGTAAFWYNLHASGKGDYLTRHAACPVLIGSKWVCNKWIHEKGQERLRPCELQPDHLL